MKKLLFTLLIPIIISSCASKPKSASVTKEKSKCYEIYPNNFDKIIFDKYQTIVGNDTISYNDIRYECLESSFISHKVMFDSYGDWSKVIYPKGSKTPVLSWSNIDLFKNGKKYTVYTFGAEEWRYIYASFMVFDENEKDVLEDKEMRRKFSNFFAKKIRRNNSENKHFYRYFNTIRR